MMGKEGSGKGKGLVYKNTAISSRLDIWSTQDTPIGCLAVCIIQLNRMSL